jgi:hypothetical protein
VGGVGGVEKAGGKEDGVETVDESGVEGSFHMGGKGEVRRDAVEVAYVVTEGLDEGLLGGEAPLHESLEGGKFGAVVEASLRPHVLGEKGGVSDGFFEGANVSEGLIEHTNSYL